MIAIKNKTKYFLLDLHKNAQIKEFSCEEALKDWLVHTTHENCYWWENKIKNSYLDEIALNINDNMESIDPVTLKVTFCNRRYMFYDEFGRIIDARVYWPEIKEKFLKRKLPRYDHRVSDEAQYGDIYYKYPKLDPESRYVYRCGPVPYTSYHWRGHFYRRPHTLNELKLNTDFEYKSYVRAKRRSLPTSWDDLKINSRGKSWKACTKKKKQWM